MARTLRKYMIHDMIPERSVNLLVGPSGAGKTTLLMDMLKQFIRGGPVLGFDVERVPVVYTAADRDDEDIDETMSRVGVEENLFQTFSLTGEKRYTYMDIPKLAEPYMTKDGMLLIIEGIHGLVPGGKYKEHDEVRSMLLDLGRMCKLHNITIIGTMHTAKTKESDRFLNPRQRALGSVAWAGYTSTVMVLEPVHAQDVEDPHREFLVLPRNKRQRKFEMTLDDSGVPRLSAGVNAFDFKQLKFLTELVQGTIYSRQNLVKLAETQSGVSSASVDRWIKNLIDDGKLEKVGYGEYVKIHNGAPIMGAPVLKQAVPVQITEESLA